MCVLRIKLTFNGILVKKKVHRCFSWQASLSFSRSSSSPSGTPQPASTHSCRLYSGSEGGQHSTLVVSLAMAEGDFSHSQRSVASELSRPMAGGDGLSARAWRSASLSSS
jgi:hypothetical protein